MQLVALVGNARAAQLDDSSIAYASAFLSGYGSTAADTVMMDGSFRLRAEAQHKRIVYLETARQQS
jgi:hypothetical protein